MQIPSFKKKHTACLLVYDGVPIKTANKAYSDLSVQGFFKRSNSFKEARIIFDYWKLCRHPTTCLAPR